MGLILLVLVLVGALIGIIAGAASGGSSYPGIKEPERNQLSGAEKQR